MSFHSLVFLCHEGMLDTYHTVSVAAYSCVFYCAPCLCCSVPRRSSMMTPYDLGMSVFSTTSLSYYALHIAPVPSAYLEDSPAHSVSSASILVGHITFGFILRFCGIRGFPLWLLFSCPVCFRTFNFAKFGITRAVCDYPLAVLYFLRLRLLGFFFWHLRAPGVRSPLAVGIYIYQVVAFSSRICSLVPRMRRQALITVNYRYYTQPRVILLTIVG